MPFLIIVLFLFVPRAHAQSVESAVSVTEKECKRLIRMNTVHGADYIPGQDARGNNVVGADLNGGNPIKMPKEITFNISIDLAEKYGFDKDGVVSASANFGQVKVKGNKVYWNGQRLNETESEAVVEACRQTYGK